MAEESYLVLFHVVSAGQNGAELGADEEQIVHLSYAIVDKSQNKVIGRYGYNVRPSTSDINENLLSEQCRTEYGLTEADIKAAASLDVVLRQFDQEAKAKGLEAHNCCLVTDGQLPVRQCLFPEATRKGITLPPYYYRFHDLRKEFAAAHPEASVSSIEDMLKVYDNFSALDIELEADLKMAERQMHAMALLVHKLICDDVKLHEPDSVQERLEQSIRSREDSVDSNCVVRARGLPWQASDQDIARFFVGLNVAKGGVALCLSNQGRRNGEALVLFDSVQHRDLALKRHKHHIGNRYIEVSKATGEDFINVAGGNNLEAQKFLSRKAQVIIRMRGLPYDASAKQVIEFFARGDNPCSLVDGEDGILFVKKPDGRATGDAFVLLAEEDDAEKALRKHKENMGSRYIELFRSTTAEVQQVLNRTMEKHSGNKHHNNSPLANGVLPPPPAVVTPNLPLIPHLPNTTLPPAAAIAASQHLITAGTRKDCIRLRGLPYEAEIENILDFLGEHATFIVNHGVHMIYNKEKQPSGEAFIQMKSEQAAFQAAQKKHYHHMQVGKKQRYIEVIQCSGEDMNYQLTGNVPSVTNGVLPPPAASSGPISVASSTAASPVKNTIFNQAAIAAAAASNPLMAAASAGLLPPGGALYNSMFGYTNGCENGLRPPHAAAAAAAAFGLPPHMSLFYWPYPSPPISPNNYFSLQQQPQMMTSIPNENGHFLSPAPPHQPPPAIIQSPTGLPASLEVSHVTQSHPLGGGVPSLIVNNNHKPLPPPSPQKNSHKVENNPRTVEVYPT